MPPPADPPWVGACTSRFPSDPTRGPRDNQKPAVRAACRYAVALSGYIGFGPQELWRVTNALATFEEHVLQTGVCLVYFASVNPATVDGLSAILRAKDYVADFVLERDDQSTNEQIAEAIGECTHGAIDRYFGELRARMNNVALDGPQSSSTPMYRKIWMAHTLAHEIESEHHALELVMRGRVDHVFVQPFDWGGLLTQAVTGQVVVAFAHADWLYEGRRILPPDLMCLIDDQGAVGPPHLMDGYASVYADMAHFAPFLNLARPDQWGHGNERVLTTHLHYRRVPFVYSHSHGLRIHWGE